MTIDVQPLHLSISKEAKQSANGC